MTHEERAREMLHSLTAINEHMGYQFTQVLMKLREDIAQALRAERERAERDAIKCDCQNKKPACLVKEEK